MHTHECTQVLVKKSYGDKRKRHKLRKWQLQQLDREMEATNQESYERDYTEFLEDLEEDKQFRQNVNIYFSKLWSVLEWLGEGRREREREGERKCVGGDRRGKEGGREGGERERERGRERE